LFDIRYSLFQSFFFDLTGRFFAGGGACMKHKIQCYLGRSYIERASTRDVGAVFNREIKCRG
jgi:hypothetical protein